MVDPLEKLKLTVVKVRLRGADKADKGPKLRTLPRLVCTRRSPKGQKKMIFERGGWEKIAKSGTRTTVCRAYSIPWESGCGH